MTSEGLVGRDLMADFIQLLIAGLATGGIYALVAIGFTLLWQTSQTINFAQGEFVMLPATMNAGTTRPTRNPSDFFITPPLQSVIY